MPTDAEMLARLGWVAEHCFLLVPHQAAIRWAVKRIGELEGALGNLVRRLDEVHDDPKYHGVWYLAQIHAGPYTGLTYTEELTTARDVLSPAAPVKEGEVTSG